MRLLRAAAYFLLWLGAGAGTARGRDQVFSDFTTPLPLPPGRTLILGIVGGWQPFDNPERIVPRIAVMARNLHIPGVFVETVENHRIQLADELIRRAFPDPSKASLILYGQSLGGPAAIHLCERLKSRGIRVRLLVVIDAVDGAGKTSYTIPSNVQSAANLYQRGSYWPIAGAKQIRAADPLRTRILCNTEYHYAYRFWKGKKIEKPVSETSLRWHWMGGHVRMEYDPEVWTHVRDLIAAELARDTQRAERTRACKRWTL